MITLRTLGQLSLTADDGRSFDGLSSQPKRLALLTYLASPVPGTWHRRDVLLSVFWPEHEPGKARTALRNALYILRQHLGTDTLRSRGENEVSLDPGLLRSDCGLVRLHLAAGRLEEALAACRGEFLPGLFIRGSEGFERWLDDERRSLKAAALKAAGTLSMTYEAAGHLEAAIAAQRQMVEWEPADETAGRRLIELLERSGDRGQALRAFETLQATLLRDFGVEPSAATIRLAGEIRSRRIARPAAPTTAPVVEAVADVEPADPILPSGEPASLAGALPVPPLRWAWPTIVVALLAFVLTARHFRPAEAEVPTPTTLLLLPMENGTGDTTNDYLASGLAEDVARHLSMLPSITIRSATRSQWPARISNSLAVVGPAFGAAVVLKTRLTQAGDSLQAEARLVDVATGVARDVGVQRFVMASLPDAGSKLAASVAGEVFRVPLPEFPRASARSVDPESYRLAMQGWHQLLGRGDVGPARELFLRATEVDPTYARAWSGLSSTWAAATVNGLVHFDEGFARAEAAARRALELDSMEGSAWANLGILNALNSRRLSAGEPYFRRALAAEPANPEIFLVYSSALRLANQWDRARDAVRVARALDPLSAFYVEREANGAMCQGRADVALSLYRAQVQLDPEDRSGQLGIARSLAGLRRWDEAIVQLRVVALARGDTALARTLPAAHGQAGYWSLKHLEGQALLGARMALARKGWVAPYLVAVAEIGAGQTERGLIGLEAELREGSRMLYKLPCNPEIDEIRSLPRFERLLKAVGSLPLDAPTE
jgi:DNA-binding SARP family transcriptional activator/TolB-like protein